MIKQIVSIALPTSPIHGYVEMEGETLETFIRNLIEPFDISDETIMATINTTLQIYNNKNDIKLFIKLLNLFDFMGLDDLPLYQCVQELLPISILTMPSNPNIKILECITETPHNDNIEKELMHHSLPKIFKLRKRDLLNYYGNNAFFKSEESKKAIASQLPYLQILLEEGRVWNRTFSLYIAEAGDLDALKWLESNEYPLDMDIPKYAARGGHLHILKWLGEYYNWDKYVCEKAPLECIKYARTRGCSLTKEACNYAVLLGRLDVLQYLHKNGCEWNESEVVRTALQSGHLNCLKYLVKNGVRWPNCIYKISNIECLKYAYENGCQLGTFVMSHFAETNNIECLKYAHENGCRWNQWTINEAAKNNHFDIVKYAYENGCPLGDHTCAYAIASNNIEILKYVHERGAPLRYQNWINATYNGNIDIMEYLYKHNCPWAKDVCCYAIRHNNLECLKYVQEHGAPPIKEACKSIGYALVGDKFIKCGNIEMLKYIHEHGGKYTIDIFIAIIKYGQIDMLKYMHEKWETVYSSDLYNIAIKYKQIECLDYLYDNGYSYRYGVQLFFKTASELGDLNIIIRLLKMGILCNNYDIKHAAEHGHFHIVKYFHENYPSNTNLTDEVFSMASISGNMELIKYLHNKQCPWNKTTVENAVTYGHTKIVKYLVENGCPHSVLCPQIATTRGYLDILIYLKEKGCFFGEGLREKAIIAEEHACLKYLTKN